MSAPTDPATTALSAVFDALEAAPQRFEFFAAVRAVERAAMDQPRLGRALTPAQEPIALAHHAAADFPRTTVHAFDRRSASMGANGAGKSGAQPRLRSQHFGLTGPMGPMPFYLTELIIYERDRRGPKPLGDFFDMVSSRLLQFYYRAWADAQPCAQADRPADDGFAAHLGAVSGAADLRFVSADERPDVEPDHFDAWARLGYAGHFAGLRSASAVADMLSSVLATPVRITEGVGRWRDIPATDLSRLGGPENDNQLGLGATLGRRFYATEWDICIVLGAADMATLTDLLPGGTAHAFLSECARAILPQHIEWTARIEIDEARIAPARLAARGGDPGDTNAGDTNSGARLGQTSWIAPQKRAGRIRDELRLHSAA